MAKVRLAIYDSFQPEKWFKEGQAPAKKRASALKHIVQYGRMKLRFSDEGMEQLAVANWLRANGIFFLHVPNEAKRHRLEAICLKMLGLEPGAADILIFDTPPLHPGYVKGVAIEMKSKTGKATDNQTAWLKQMDRRDWLCYVCNGADEAIKQLTELGYDRRTV